MGRLGRLIPSFHLSDIEFTSPPLGWINFCYVYYFLIPGIWWDMVTVGEGVGALLLEKSFFLFANLWLWGLCRVDKRFVTIGICSRHIRNTLALHAGFLAYTFSIPFSVYFLTFSLSIPSPFPCVDLPCICATLLSLAILFIFLFPSTSLVGILGFAALRTFFPSPLGGVDFSASSGGS